MSDGKADIETLERVETYVRTPQWIQDLTVEERLEREKKLRKKIDLRLYVLTHI